MKRACGEGIGCAPYNMRSQGSGGLSGLLVIEAGPTASLFCSRACSTWSLVMPQIQHSQIMKVIMRASNSSKSHSMARMIRFPT